MKIYVKFRDLGKKYKFDEPDSLQEILDNCPVLSSLFCEKIRYGGPWPYEINHDDNRLRMAMSEIDRFRNNPDYDSLIADSSRLFRELLHLSMYKKKNMEVTCYKTRE